MLRKLSWFLVLLVGASAAQNNTAALTVSPIPLDHKIPLTAALAQIGLHVEDGYVLCGIDLGANSEPQVELNLSQSSLSVAIAQAMSQAPGFTYEFVSPHVVDVHPIERNSNDDEVLNLQVAKFTVTNIPAMNIFSRPKDFIPELKAYFLEGQCVKACGGIGPGLGATGPGVTLSLQNVTVKQVLDAVAEADAVLAAHAIDHSLPVGWVHSLKPDPRNGPVHAWSFLSTVPRNWTRFLSE